MIFLKDKIKLTISFIVLTGFVFFALFGLFTIMPMHMNADKNIFDTSHCPYMEGGSSVCPMNSFNNIEMWQNTLRVILNEAFYLVFVLLLLTTTSLFPKETLWLKEMYEWQKIKRYRLKYFTFYKPLLYSYLFSQGILNSKSY